MADDREQLDRLYAASLLNRAAPAQFEPRDVALLARVLPLIEANLADWLGQQAPDVITDEGPIIAIRGGQARPEPYMHRDLAKLEFDQQGLPWACSVRDDLGLPVFFGRKRLEVLLNDQLVDQCVAYDRRAGTIWKYRVDSAGQPCLVNGKLTVERLQGAVAVRWKKDEAA